MKVTAQLNNLRISPRKVRLVADLIKNLDIEEAGIQAENIVKRSSPLMGKLLNSAVANAENNFGLDRNNLYVYDVRVGEGVKLKRWMPRAFGRASQILKRSSNITLILEERVEGRNRKTKQQMDKEKKEREEARKKSEQKMKEEKLKKEKESEEAKKSNKFEEIKLKKKEENESKKGERKGGWVKKFFRRKSA